MADKKHARRVEQEQIVSAAILWKRETDREGVALDTLSETEMHLYRVVARYMAQRSIE